MRELSLFSGAGGGLLGSKLLGWTTIGYVEFNDYCQRVIRQRIEDGIFDNAPIFGDIRAFNNEGYAESYRGMVDIITAGFPCQPFSVAGKQAGADDPRNMWPETIRTIRTVRPKFALLENVPGILSTGYVDRICGDIVESGYDCRWRILSAAELGAPHKRDRLWIVAHTHCERQAWANKDLRSETQMPELSKFINIRCALSDTAGRRLERQESAGGERKQNGLPTKCGWWTTEPELGRVAHGVANRVDRLKATGNGQVPLCMAYAYSVLSSMVGGES